MPSRESDDEIRAVVEEAAAQNRYVTGHAYTARAVNRGLRLGVRGIEHGNLIDDDSLEAIGWGDPPPACPVQTTRGRLA